MNSLSPRWAKYLFIGERPSNRALKMGVTWRDGKLAAKTLFDGLREIGLNPEAYEYLNVFVKTRDKVNGHSIAKIKKLKPSYILVGMGKKVQKILTKYKLKHIGIIHPAARGKIRKKSLYIGHLRKILIK